MPLKHSGCGSHRFSLHTARMRRRPNALSVGESSLVQMREAKNHPFILEDITGLRCRWAADESHGRAIILAIDENDRERVEALLRRSRSSRYLFKSFDRPQRRMG